MAEGPGTREELLDLLWEQARAGGVTAMRLLLQEMRRAERDGTGPKEHDDFIDELMAKRREP